MKVARIGSSFSAQLLGLAVTFADRFLVVGLLLRILGASAYADWILLVSAAGLVMMAELGFNIYWGNEYQRADALKDDAAFARLVRIALGFAALAGAVLAAICLAILALTNPVASLSLRTVASGDAKPILALLFLAMILRVMRGSISQIYRGRGIFGVGILVDQVNAAALVVGVAAAAALQDGLLPLAAVYLGVETLFGWGLMLFDLRRRFPSLRFVPARATADERRQVLAHVRWFAVQQGAPVVWQQAPLLMLGASGVAGAEIVSFTLLRTLTNFAKQMSTMAAISIGVELAGAFHAGERERFATELGTFTVMVSGVAGAIAAAMATFGGAFVAMWTGDAGLFSAAILGWFIAALLATAPSTMLIYALMFCNHPRAGAVGNLVQLSVGLLAALPLARFHGAAGAAAGLAIGDIVGIAVVLPILGLRALNVPFRRALLRSVAAMLACAGWGALCGVVVTGQIVPSGPLRFVVAAGCWSALMIPALIATMSATHRAALKRRLGAL